MMPIEKKKKYLEWILNLSVVGMLFSIWLNEATLASKIFWTSFWIMVICFIEYIATSEKEEKQLANKIEKSMTPLERGLMGKERG